MNLDLERQMQHSQKLESLGVMAGGIAHDFNNILTVIIANAELCLQHVAPDCPARESVEDILSAGDRAAAIARQMLDYSGHGAFILKPIDANQLIRDMKHLLSVSVPKNASISERLSPAVPTFDGSETQIRQVVMNLIINAAESLGDRPGSVVLVSGAETYSSARLADCVNPDAPHALPAGDYVFIEVIDNGCGMSAETIVKIFDPFFTTKFTGRGLGMSAVLGIMRGHHGAIEIESNPGQGTRFRVLFPVSELQPGSSSSPGTAIATDDWQGHGTILMVDDEKPILTIGRRMLEHLGFKVIPATNGRQALDAFRQHAGEISAVLLDLSMPELGGEEVFREMNRLHPEIPVILTSGFGEQAATRSFAGKGLAGFLSKPFTVAELKSRLRKATAGLPR